MKPRLRRLILSIGFSLTMVLTVAWILSWWWRASVYFGGWVAISCHYGVVKFYNYSDFDGATHWHFERAAHHEFELVWWLRFNNFVAIIPLWIPWLAVLGGTVFVWLRFKPPATGHCSCGYNLAGNESGACPECGTPVAE